MRKQDSDRFCKAILALTVLIAVLFLGGVGQAMAQRSLVERLSEGDHHVEVILRPKKSAKLFRDQINRHNVIIKFTDTNGGTEIRIALDRDARNLEDADFDGAQGTVHLEGTLTLNEVVADREIENKVKQIIVEKLGVDENQVTPDARFIDDLGANSQDTVELVMRFEAEFGIEIPDEDAQQIQSVRDAYNYIEKHKLRCIIDIDLSTLEGTGHLVKQ